MDPLKDYQENQMISWQTQIILSVLKMSENDLLIKYPENSPFLADKGDSKLYFGKSISSIRRRKRIQKLKQIDQINKIGSKQFKTVPLKDESLKQYKIDDDSTDHCGISEGKDGGE